MENLSVENIRRNVAVFQKMDNNIIADALRNEDDISQRLLINLVVFLCEQKLYRQEMHLYSVKTLAHV